MAYPVPLLPAWGLENDRSSKQENWTSKRGIWVNKPPDNKCSVSRRRVREGECVSKLYARESPALLWGLL